MDVQGAIWAMGGCDTLEFHRAAALNGTFVQFPCSNLDCFASVSTCGTLRRVSDGFGGCGQSVHVFNSATFSYAAFGPYPTYPWPCYNPACAIQGNICPPNPSCETPYVVQVSDEGDCVCI